MHHATRAGATCAPARIFLQYRFLPARELLHAAGQAALAARIRSHDATSMAVSLPVSVHVNLVAHRMVMVVGMRRHHDAEGGERRSAGKDRFLHHIFLCSDGVAEPPSQHDPCRKRLNNAVVPFSDLGTHSRAACPQKGHDRLPICVAGYASYVTSHSPGHTGCVRGGEATTL
jgi:hypothetical protein